MHKIVAVCIRNALQRAPEGLKPLKGQEVFLKWIHD